MNEISLIGAFLLGLMGAGHCIGMCGGIISTLSLATNNDQSKWYSITSYQFGRIMSYSVFGLLSGLIGQQAETLTVLPILKIISGILLILMGLYISRVWMVISQLEKAGKYVWDKISPLSSRLLPVKSLKQAFLLGALWGWLPCGLVYTSLAYALTAANPVNSMLFMLAFGIGTLPATLTVGAASSSLKTWLNTKAMRWLAAVIFITIGSYMLYGLLAGDISHHHHH